jgi:hypothetical protein
MVRDLESIIIYVKSIFIFYAFLCSYEFNEVLYDAADVVLDFMVEELASFYGNDNTKSLPLAKIIPQVASIGADVLDCTGVNSYIKVVGELAQVHRLCAIIYTGSNN